MSIVSRFDAWEDARPYLGATEKKKIGRNDPCWCGSGKKYKKCHMADDSAGTRTTHSSAAREATPPSPETAAQITRMRPVPAHIECPKYAIAGGVERVCRGYSRLRGPMLEQMRKTCGAARRVLDRAIDAVRPGLTTDALDAIVHEACISEGGYPSPRNYHGFPKSVCTSVNEVICHGIPNHRPLANGDIVNIDVTLFLGGLHGDCSETVAVGDIDVPSRHLLATARECLRLGIGAVRPYGRIRDIGRAIADYAHREGCSVVRAYCGHGIGQCFHMAPQVFHHRTNSGAAKIEPGMVFTVEPMINMGGWQHALCEDGWTAVTADGRRSAQFEHTILVTETGTEILTSATGNT